MPKAPANLNQLESLVEIVSALRGPDGCPWDKEQTHESLTQYAIEEAHEFVEVTESSLPAAEKNKLMKEELGDMLFQVILHAQLASERGAFNLTDVIHTLSEKLVRRHPHVFTDAKVADTAEVIRNWEIIKKNEKKSDENKYAINVPPLPALQKAYKIGKRTEKLQFDWQSAAEVMTKVQEEYEELQEALEENDKDHIKHELGDMFFSLAQLGRHLDLEPEQVLRRANDRFLKRFSTMLDLVLQDRKDFGALNTTEKEEYWSKAKKLLKG
jgi:tetrapyrrole methylase family protein/MazG family protein